MKTTDNIYVDYNPTKQEKVLIVFDAMISDIAADDKLSPMIKELLLRGRKRNISLIFISKSSFKVLSTRTLNATHYFIIKIPNKRNVSK